LSAENDRYRSRIQRTQGDAEGRASSTTVGDISALLLLESGRHLIPNERFAQFDLPPPSEVSSQIQSNFSEQIDAEAALTPSRLTPYNPHRVHARTEDLVQETRNFGREQILVIADVHHQPFPLFLYQKFY
jgi:hypothetical protein